ncbi:osmotic avoidance abnormal protein 3 isoform X2 [Tribolium castaneum]|uniref:osmotic avoidance abnormal protein 3 isoform X2 n=1 Tax=Tribolium castaneum TaxID=7070 RepID=UPI00046C3265|nr:PREDICTED: osmotic avoidance abnormal protein 3 isoform X2 [Tribolium castaneum]|eukprot:XP_008190588.1 PREDICTED: osmotic avoidance abnormal protein 3 isoform X2 [Tribolium castaneum]
MAENVKVIVRCRPMNKKEQDLNCDCVVKMRNCVVETFDPSEGPSFPKQFTFDSTYDQDSTTEMIYNDICYPLVESVLEGYNATIFVYGQTGCGKSHTMEGEKSGPEKGVISRAFEHIFEAISVTTGVKYLALISYLEIYNEQIRDLLLPSDKIGNSALNLKESPTEGVTVPGLTSHPVHNAAECEHFLNLGSKNRIIGATLMNQNSSRSHSIFTISIEQITNVNNNESFKKGKLNLVDLAGSERQAKTGATGDRLKEATKINLSLSALGNVISALVDGKAKHIPYRDSKLTRLLQDSLGGNTRTLMIACISPSSRDYVETLSTLRYANRAKNIHNKPRVNEDPKDTMLRQYQEEIERLKSLLGQQVKIEEVKEIETSPNSDLDAKRDQLIQEYQQEMEKLKNLHECEKHEKENVLKQIDLIKDEYEKNIEKLNSEIQEKKRKELCSKEEILNRIEALKNAMIGGEKANDKELSERRKRKKQAAEKRASVIAHLLAKIDMNEDREILHNQYKDISQELNLKTEALRKYRHKVKALEKEISDIQSEFEAERQDYLETIRKQDQHIKLLAQISDKIASTLKKECNYSDLESIKEQAVWLEDLQKYKLPDLITPRTKLPPPGRLHDIQTAPARLQESLDDDSFDNDFLEKKLEKSEKEDIIGSYFAPTTKRAAELLNQSSRIDANRVISTWRDFARRNKPKVAEEHEGERPGRPPNLNSSLNNLWVNEGTPRKPLRLEALPNIDRHRSRNQRLNTLDIL